MAGGQDPLLRGKQVSARQGWPMIFMRKGWTPHGRNRQRVGSVHDSPARQRCAKEPETTQEFVLRSPLSIYCDQILWYTEVVYRVGSGI